MERAKLNVSKSKSGSLIVKVFLIETNKEMSVQNFSHKDALSLNGHEVDIEREKGQIVKIWLNEEAIYSKSSIVVAPKKQTGQQADMKQPCIACSPYNFIPLNTVVVEAEPIPAFDTYHKDRLTGYIELHIEAKTPLYIRDTVDEQQLRENKEAKDIPDFCSTAGRPRIPGSSLRGMTRTMVEIVSFGKFGFFDDRRLYFRAVADRSRLGEDYKETMVDITNNHFPKIKAGILKKNGRNYKIYPSKTISNTQIYRINFDKLKKVVDGTTAFIVPNFDFRDAYYMPVAPTDHRHTMPNGQTHNLRYAKLTSISTIKNAQHPQKGFIIASGEFGNKKHMHWVINEPDTQFLEVAEVVINEYKNDANRKEETDILKKIINRPDGVPCFFITDDNGNIISFGHTGMFRLAYKKTIGQHIPQALQDKSNIDLAEAIFGKINGNGKTFASRVFFEDAFCNQKKEDAEMGVAHPQVLSSPKPTTFQHYLEQKPDNLKDHPKNLAHYNSNANIRGNKLYWHKSGNGWQEHDTEKIEKHKSQYNQINPLKADTTFTSRIRFENLSSVELGALLFALELPKGCCHKFGMGKSLGLGSVKTAPILFISDRTNRYTSLFAEWETPIAEADKSEYKKTFEAYVLKALKETRQTIWENVRMKELNTMLDFDRKPPDDNTRYMMIEPNEFKARCVLAKPTETV